MVFLSLGSNLGDRKANILEASRRIAQLQGVKLKQISSLYETEAVEVTNQPDFLNAAAEIETKLEPLELLQALLRIEHDMGRVRGSLRKPRPIDIDILLFEGVALNTPELTIPHPRMMNRAFVMVPLEEIAPDLELPDGRKPGEVLQSLMNQPVRGPV